MPIVLNLNKDWHSDEVEVILEHNAAIARNDYWSFRQLMHPDMVCGWFQRQVADEFQQFHADLIAGKRPKLILQSPPQHGKSSQVTDFIAWLAGQNPQLRTIYGSFSNRLGIRANLWLQRMIDTDHYRRIFGTRMADKTFAVSSHMPLRTREIIEWVHDGKATEGYFRNTTVNGSVTGEGSDLGVIDDPIKGRAEANSPVIRDKVWDWLTDDFMSRFSENAGLLMILTRWHVDDPAGRLQEAYPDLRVLKYQAIATKDEQHRKKGDALFPQLKSIDFLRKQREPMTQAGWESVYQQNPIIVGGGLFPIEKFGEPLKARPDRSQIRKSIRYWDKAGTQGDGAYTAGVRIDWMKEGGFIISDVIRGQWSFYEREQRIKQTAAMDNVDGNSCDIWVEQEPGSGGKESAERTVLNLAGYNVFKDRVKGDKELRAEPYAAQVQAGNFRLVASQRWNRDFLDEHETFPNGKYKDQVDAAGGAFAKLLARRIEQPTTIAFPVYGE